MTIGDEKSRSRNYCHRIVDSVRISSKNIVFFLCNRSQTIKTVQIKVAAFFYTIKHIGSVCLDFKAFWR